MKKKEKKYNFEKFKKWLNSNEWLIDYYNCSRNLKPLHNYIVKINENEKKNVFNESCIIVEEINNIFGLEKRKSGLIYNSLELEIIKKWMEIWDSTNENSQELQFQLEI